MDTKRTDLQDNPLLKTSSLPPFDMIRPEHVEDAVRTLIEQTKNKIEHIESNLKPSWNGLLAPLEEIGLPFEYAWAPVVHLLGVRNCDELRKAHEKMLGEVVALDLRIRQSQPIYAGLKKIKESSEWNTLNAAQKRVVELKLRDAELAGVGLTGEARQRFNAIEQELSRLSTDFANHVLDATKAFELIITEKNETDGWPESLKNLAAQSYNQSKKDGNSQATPEHGPWRITLDYPSFMPFMQHSKNREQRKKLYVAFVTRASIGKLDNSKIIEQILKLRREQSLILGFETYAQLSLATKMAPDVPAVETMFRELSDAAKPYAANELEELKELAMKNGQKDALTQWDIAFWAERMREERFDYTDEQLRPYFTLERVLEGLFALSEKLFGITITKAHGEAPVWHPDVSYFKVSDTAGDQIASFYLDPYTRPHEKRGGAWMDNCLSRRKVSGELRLPVVHLCCNSTPPVGDKPSLMSFTEVRTLFHEFGHGLQAMLTTVAYTDVAGINGIEWDAVELASQFMENWCYHKPTIMSMARHFETGEALPEELFDKIRAARIYRAGSLMMRQLEFGMTDMYLHHEHDPVGNLSAFDVHRHIAKQTSILPPFKKDRFLCSFTHIFAGGYAAGYYGYKWSEVLSADAFSAFEEAGLDNARALAELGRKFRRTILACGGSRHPIEVFEEFRGRQPRTTALLRHSGLL